MNIYVIRFVFLLLACLSLVGCGGGGGGGDAAAVLNQPALPVAPIASLTLGDDFVGFIIGKQPLNLDPSSADSLRFTQQLYELDADNNITPVPMFDSEGVQIDFIGNLSFTDVENITPLDIMVLSPDYLLLTVFHRNFDLDDNNDYFNLLIDLHDGSVTAAPLGLNTEGNSGRSNLTQAGRDVFPADTRWNLTDDLYVISVDYDELGLMQSVDYVLDEDPEIVDHHNGVPCPVNEEESDTIDETDTTDTTDVTDTTDETTDTDTTAATDETTETCVGTVGASTQNTDTTTPEETTDILDETTDNSDETSDTTEETSLESTFDINDLPTPTALYRMDLAEGNQYTLVKVSAPDDRPGLGQLIISDNGTIIYRNDDGGDNSYRVLIPDCEGVTGRVSTVLLAPFNSLIIAPDRDGISSVFEVTYSGMNKLHFSCNGNIEREAYTAYSTSVSSLKLPYNSPSIATYDYAYPYFLNTSCQSANLFPAQPGFTSILSPMPIIPGLARDDVRGIRKSQFFDDKLYCIGYNASLELAVAELDPSNAYPQYEFLNFDFDAWIPRFDTVHVLSNGNVIFTGTTRVASTVRTIMVDTAGVETDLGDALGGLVVAQQIEIIPPGATYTLPTVEEATAAQ
jgi:hypothetical protein